MVGLSGVKMLRKIRIIIAAVVLVLTTLLFLDFTGTIHGWFGWLTKMQLIPAILATNTVVIITLTVLTLLFGRIYCSVICPLGIFQDGISNISGQRKGKKNRFRYSPAKSWLRYGMTVLFIAALIAGVSVIVAILDPYAAYGRMASNFFSPLYRWGNNLLAIIAEKVDSYAFYSTDVRIKGWSAFGVAVVTLFAVGILAWRNGRTYCNTLCPAGTLFGFLSKFSLFRLILNEEKCTQCNVCERNCKASCINIKTVKIDRSRCVACFNCIDNCKSGAIKYAPAKLYGKKITPEPVQNTKNKTDDFSRRNMLASLGTMLVAGTIKAQQLHVDGGLAEIENKKIPDRKTPIVPPGALSIQNMKSKCTACQLCVSVCPNNILRPSDKLSTLMQPEMSFEHGFCRPECVECSLVCPTGAIRPVTTADKSALSIGWAVWIKENCVVNRDEVQCKACENHCPTGAITLLDNNSAGNSNSLKIPAIDKERCIGCGACEYHCPARPFSAIYVEGHLRHHSI